MEEGTWGLTKDNSDQTVVAVNKHQTPIDIGLKKSLDEEVFANLLEFINSVEFVKNLVSPNRPTVKDLERRADGRAIIDVTRPHILEDMEYFIKDRRHFEKYGYYTAAKFSRNPNSDFMRYWDEQQRRSIEGYVNLETGEWISGYNYFYWNFGHIDLTVAMSTSHNGDRVRSDRIEQFPDIWEIDYFFFHYIEQGEEAGEYGALLKCRGMGASFKSANMAIRNFFLIRKSKSYVFSYHSNYLFEDGIMNKVLVAENFMQTHTAFKKRKLNNTLEHLQTGYKDKNNNNANSGYLSEVIPVITKDPNSARGKRGKLVIHEEGGSHRYLIKSWDITDKSLNDKGNVFGYQLAQGTGGDDQSDFKGLMQLFFRPRGYHVYAIRNVFDKNASSTLCGFFMGEYMNRPRSYNENGVTDVVKNLITIFQNRQLLEREIDDAEVLSAKKAEGAITPLESITTIAHTVFPKTAAKIALAELASNWEALREKHTVCRLGRTGDKVSVVRSSDYIAINEYPYTGNQIERAGLVLKCMPETHPDGSIPSYRYIIGVDTLDDDEGEANSSRFSFMIMDLWKDDVVGWYIGRSMMVQDDYELVLCAALFFNATINYESNLKGLYGHFKNMNALGYLADTPQILLDKALIGKSYTIGNKSKGTRANTAINAWGRRLQADWMRKSHLYYENKTGIETLEDREYLQEVSMWDPMGNFDKISAGNMLFIYREELIKLTENTKFDASTPSEYDTDPFFKELESKKYMVSQDLIAKGELNF